MNATLTVALLGIWGRNRHRLVTALPLLGVVAAFVALHIVVASFALDGPQVKDRELGPSTASVAIPEAQARRRPDRDDVRTALQHIGARNVREVVYGSDFAVDGLRTTGLSTGPQDRPQYSEWQEGGRPPRLTLATGRWADRPGEVTLSQSLSTRLGAPSTIHVFSGTTTLRVVGTFRDTYATDALAAVGVPGTWERMRDAARTGYPGLSSVGQYFWEGATLDAALPVLARLHQAPVDVLRTGALDADTLTTHPQRSLATRSAYLVLLPALLMTGATQLSTVSTLSKTFRAQRAAMTRIGIPRSSTAPPMLGVVLTVCVGASLAGVVVGLLVGGVARRLVLPHLATQPLGPALHTDRLVVSLLALTTALSVTSIVMAASRWHSARRPRTRLRSITGWTRRIVGAALLATAGTTVYGARELDGAVRSTVLCAAALALFTPDILVAAIRAVRLPTLPGVLALANLRADERRISVLGSALCFCLAIPAGVNVLTASYLHSNAALSMAVPGQLLLQSPDGNPVPPGLPERLATGADLQTAVPVRMLQGQITSGQKPGAYAVMVVTSVDDVEKVLDVTLDDDRRAILRNGGILTFTPGPGSVRLTLDDGRTVSVPSDVVDVHPTWAHIYGGVVLDDAVSTLGAAAADDRWVYLDTDDAHIAAAVDLVRDARLDPRLLTYYQDPPAPQMPWAWWTISSTLLLAAGAVTTSICASFGRTARNQSRQLLAVGLPPAFARAVSVLTALFLVGVCGALATLVATAPLLLARQMAGSLRLFVPPTWTLGWVVTLACLAVLAPVAGLRGVRADARVPDALI